MHLPNHINPDHFLYTPDGRSPTAERAKAAWELAYQELERQVADLGPRGVLYVVCGLQGAGKSTWVRRQANAMPGPAIFFDAALPSRKHRSRALGLAAASTMPATAVWINVPFEVALARNTNRPEQERVPRHIIEHVLEQLEPPSISEGFTRVIEVADANGGG